MERKLSTSHMHLLTLGLLNILIEKSNISIKPLLTYQKYGLTRSQQEIDTLDVNLTDLVSKMNQMNDSFETLNKRYLELTELRHVLRETAVFFDEAEAKTETVFGRDPADPDSHLLNDMEVAERGGERTHGVSFVAGVVPRSRLGTFEKIMWRLSRGNCYMNFADVEEAVLDPVTGESVKKSVFIIFAHGRELLSKLKKACEALGATIYPIDQNAEKRREDALEVISRLEDLKHVLDGTKTAMRTELLKIAENFSVWSTILQKEKAVYYQMNLFRADSNRKAFIAEGWCPTTSIGTIQYSLRSVTERTGSTVSPILSELKTNKTPPTFHRTNKFTAGFQNIVDAYGMANYQEVNPGLFTTISFPFLFAVMFGDLGHGLIMFIFAAWMCLYEKSLSKIKGEMWGMLFGGRYIVLLKGAFSVYTGLIYNDIFSLWLNWFRTGYTWVEEGSEMVGVKRWTYGFGIDPAWHEAENQLVFMNSYKMKMAVIFGVIQMSFGIILNVFNHLHFKKPMFIILETVPQLIFLLSIFGYLVGIMIYKWLVDWSKLSPPGLLNTLIYMFLSPGNVKAEETLFSGQAGVQVVLVLIAVVCVPWMLLGKPYYLYREHNKHRSLGYATVASPATTPTTSDGEAPIITPVAEHLGEHEKFEFSEVMIHQMIHTIEFCLGAISNTASYLRLWALSLAHAQLSEVLWSMVMGGILSGDSSIKFLLLVGAFVFWFGATVGILIVMEGLSAFLHALRLHWVEFNNKFYGGSGYAFRPFSFIRLLEGDDNE